MKNSNQTSKGLKLPRPFQHGPIPSHLGLCLIRKERSALTTSWMRWVAFSQAVNRMNITHIKSLNFILFGHRCGHCGSNLRDFFGRVLLSTRRFWFSGAAICFTMACMGRDFTWRHMKHLSYQCRPRKKKEQQKNEDRRTFIWKKHVRLVYILAKVTP